MSTFSKPDQRNLAWDIAAVALLALAAPFLLFPERRWLWAPALLILPLVWAGNRLSSGHFIPRTPYDGAILLLLFMVLVSLYATYDISASLPKITGVALGISILYAVVRIGRHPHGWWLTLLAFVGGGAAIAGVGVLGMKAWTKFYFMKPIVARLPGAIGGLTLGEKALHPNEVAGALLWLIPLLVVFSTLALSHIRDLQRTWGWARALGAAGAVLLTTAFTLAVFILTQSRGGYIGLALILLALIFMTLPRRQRWLFLGGAGAALAAAILFIFWGGGVSLLRTILGTSSDPSSALSLNTLQGRMELWSRALYAIQDFPLTGMGMNTFRTLVRVLYPLFYFSPDFDIGHAHNEFLQAAIDLGLPGLIAFLGLYIIAFWMLFKIWQLGPAQPPAPAPGLPAWPRALVLGLGGGLAAHMIYGLTDAVALGAKPGILFWMLLGLIATLFARVQCHD